MPPSRATHVLISGNRLNRCLTFVMNTSLMKELSCLHFYFFHHEVEKWMEQCHSQESFAFTVWTNIVAYLCPQWLAPAEGLEVWLSSPAQCRVAELDASPALWACSLQGLTEFHTYRDPTLGLMFCCHPLEILNYWMWGLIFILCWTWQIMGGKNKGASGRNIPSLPGVDDSASVYLCGTWFNMNFDKVKEKNESLLELHLPRVGRAHQACGLGIPLRLRHCLNCLCGFQG